MTPQSSVASSRKARDFHSREIRAFRGSHISCLSCISWFTFSFASSRLHVRPKVLASVKSVPSVVLLFRAVRVFRGSINNGRTSRDSERDIVHDDYYQLLLEEAKR